METTTTRTSGGRPQHGPGDRIDDREAGSAGSEDTAALLQYLVDRAHEAVDLLAARAAPALGRFAGGPASAGPDHPAARAGVSPHRDSAAPDGIALEPFVQGSMSLVRRYPVAALATAVVAGLAIAKLRAR